MPMSHPVATTVRIAWWRGDSLVDGGGGASSRIVASMPASATTGAPVSQRGGV